MLEDFEDAYYLVLDISELALDAARIFVRYLVFMAIPVWIIPYAIYKAVKEAREDGI